MSARTSSIPLAALTPRRSNVVCGTVAASALWGGERRMEGEAYLMGGYGFRVRIEGLPSFKRVSAFARVWQPGRLKGVTISSDKGVPFFATNQTSDIRPVVRKWLAANQVDDLERRYLRPGTVLITCSGNGVANNVGKVFASYSAHEGIVISHDLLRVDPIDANDFGWLYAFLRSRFGRAMLRSNQYGSSIKHLEPEHVDMLPVPDASVSMVRELQDRVKRVFALRDEAYSLTLRAEGLFAKALGMPSEASSELGYQIAASRMFVNGRRLDGHHFNPMAEAVAQTVASSALPTERLSSVAGVFGVPRFKHLYADTGTPYLDSEDVLKVNPDLTKFIPDVSEKDARVYFVKRSWVLVVCSGQIYGINGSAALASPRLENKVLSNHVIRVVPKDTVRPGYLQMALGHHSLSRPLMLRMAFGTSVPEIAPDDLREFPVVRIGTRRENTIADAVELASDLRTEADNAEDEAVALTEAYVEAVLRGDPMDERHDAAMASVRLREVEAHPERLVRGDALESRLDALQG